MPLKNSLFVFFGMVASGKSTLSQAFAKRHGMKYYNSDVVRKELAGLVPGADQKEPLDKGIYSRDFSRKTYDALLKYAGHDLGKGISVVVDASYQNRTERGRVLTLAENEGVAIFFVHCVCSDEETGRRLDLRAKDPNAVSDGRWEIYLAQKQRFEPPTELPEERLITIATEAPIDALMKKLENRLISVNK